MLKLGMIVLIYWPGTELHLCRGTLFAVEQKLTAIKDLTCGDGAKIINVVGVDEKRLLPVVP